MHSKILLKRSNRNLRKNETVEEACHSITHLHMSDLNLTSFELERLNLYSSAVCLYCYDNHLQTLEGIENLDLLEEIQAQHNELTEIVELQPFVLRKLDLRHNKINKISGLSQQPDLRELYLSYQEVPRVELTEGCFASQCLSLEVLELSNCGIEELHELFCLQSLISLNLSENQISSFDELKGLFASCRRLDSIDLRGNPICKQVRYREKTIIMGYFHELDGKEVIDTQRETLIRMQMRRGKTAKKAETPNDLNPLTVKRLNS
ncbi:hypothetical protein TRFO_06352 [Tritrichomonas foetus]|uniref:Leucine Rich Repeat family protein n=1 Tax=Tritrichomonas foetus TaxID=1144522 RepID=A0A1J4K0Y6_9EUKA|nr:hypothetical protein TRFO_06352 [Tritrichomonas foetus]|eukprot:OHT04448.1 hypothetical protein TRFO_06352 [Tritrichomonas foetus]